MLPLDLMGVMVGPVKLNASIQLYANMAFRRQLAVLSLGRVAGIRYPLFILRVESY